MFERALLFFCVLINIANFEEIDENYSYTDTTIKNLYESQNEDNILKKQLEFLPKFKDTKSTFKSQILETQKFIDSERIIRLKRNLKLTRIETLLENEQKHVQELTKEVDLKDEKIAERQVASKSQETSKNCKEIRDRGNHKSDIYVIRPKSQAFKVFCDMETNGGGWTVFQRRVDGSEDFNLTWTAYKQGFGNLDREFWLGLKYLNQLTADGNNELYVELVDKNHKKAFASYSNFSVASEEKGFSLSHLSNYQGTAGDSLTYHNGQNFRTGDRDVTCAALYGGGWWFSNCLYSNLNGAFFKSGSNPRRAQGINWFTFSTDNYSLLESKMMTRPK